MLGDTDRKQENQIHFFFCPGPTEIFYLSEAGQKQCDIVAENSDLEIERSLYKFLLLPPTTSLALGRSLNLTELASHLKMGIT